MALQVENVIQLVIQFALVKTLFTWIVGSNESGVVVTHHGHAYVHMIRKKQTFLSVLIKWVDLQNLEILRDLSGS